MQGTWRNRFEAIRSAFGKSLDSSALNRDTLKQLLKGEEPMKAGSVPGKNHQANDRRRSRRMNVDHDVSYWSKDDEPRCAHLVNICRDGLYLETDAALELGQIMKIKLPAMGAQRFPGITTGRIVRQETQGVAIRWR